MLTLLTTLGAMLTFLTTVIVLYQNTRKRLQEIHVLVNSRLTEVLTEVSILRRKLKDEGIELPQEDSK